MKIRAKNEEIREEMKNEYIEFPCDRYSDPLTSVKVVSNGNIQIQIESSRKERKTFTRKCGPTEQ